MDTRQTLLDQAAELIRTCGYNGFSYADLAERVGIRKASIHHHFPTKEDLGLALVDQYIEQFAQSLQAIDLQLHTTHSALHAYAQLYRNSVTKGWGCLCGMLASEVDVIPPAISAGVRRFMTLNLDWLGKVIALSPRRARVGNSPSIQAEMILSICQGALLVARAMQSPDSFDHAVSGVLVAFGSD